MHEYSHKSTFTRILNDQCESEKVYFVKTLGFQIFLFSSIAAAEVATHSIVIGQCIAHPK